MARDARTKHLRRLRKLHRSARGWTVRAGLLLGATAVAVPYHGLGLVDAVWAAASGGSVGLAIWRWRDLKSMAALPVPEPPPAISAATQVKDKIESAIRALPAGSTMIDEVAKYRTQVRYRGLSVAGPLGRLDQAVIAMGGLAGTLNGSAGGALGADLVGGSSLRQGTSGDEGMDDPVLGPLAEAKAAELSLRTLGERVASVEKALRIAPADAAGPLSEAHQAMLAQLEDGVSAYELLVTAVAGYLAEDGRVVPKDGAASRLVDAADLLRGVSEGLAQLRHVRMP